VTEEFDFAAADRAWYDCRPDDWRDLQWHLDPTSPRFKSWEAAERRARYLNREHHDREEWVFTPGHDEFKYVRLLRRWVGLLPPA
jgi:hypothetical protein